MPGERLDAEWVRSWWEQTDEALTTLMQSFLPTHGFPPGHNAVMLATNNSDQATDALVDLTPIPSDLTTLYWVISEASCPTSTAGISSTHPQRWQDTSASTAPSRSAASGSHWYSPATVEGISSRSATADKSGSPLRLPGLTTSTSQRPAFRSSSSRSADRSRTSSDHGRGAREVATNPITAG